MLTDDDREIDFESPAWKTPGFQEDAVRHRDAPGPNLTMVSTRATCSTLLLAVMTTLAWMVRGGPGSKFDQVAGRLRAMDSFLSGQVDGARAFVSRHIVHRSQQLLGRRCQFAATSLH